MSTHKYRKGFREDQVMMSEAYLSVYNESLRDVAPEKTLFGDRQKPPVDDEEGPGDHIDLSQWWKYEPHEVIQQVMWRNRVVKGPDHDEAKFWAEIEPKLNKKWPRPTEDEEKGEAEDEDVLEEPGRGETAAQFNALKNTEF